MSKPDILPCPFCGSEEVENVTAPTGHNDNSHALKCKKCAATIERYMGDVVEAWNTRTPSPSRYAKDVLKSAEENHIWVSAIACVNPSDAFLLSLGREVLNKILDRNNQIDSNFDGTPMEGLQKETIIRFNAS